MHEKMHAKSRANPSFIEPPIHKTSRIEMSFDAIWSVAP